ncbi:MAG: rhomboid family intramembrane serine protease [Acetivibrionales bacterium]|jgi:rhomboid protease GluP
MKTNYFNAVTTDLIENLDFIPFRDRMGSFIVSDGFIALERRSICNYRVIELIDADRLTTEQVKNHLEKNSYSAGLFIESDVSEDFELIQVFIFSGRPGIDKVDVLKKPDFCKNTQKHKIENIIVDLESSSISVYPEGSMTVYDILTVLKDRLDSNLSGFDEMPCLHSLVYKREQECVIEEATKSNPATYVFIGINIVLWLLGLLAEMVYGINHISAFGIKYSPYIVRGEYWRLLTPMFLHSDVVHLATNSFSLFILGQVVERIFGTRKFIFIYIISGIIGNIISFAFSNNPSLGASGAVLGIGGALIYVWRKKRRAFSGRSRQYMTLVFMVLFNVFYGFSRPGIDNYAHLGGVISGYLAGGIVRFKKDNSNAMQIVAFTSVLLAMGIAGIYLGFIRFG